MPLDTFITGRYSGTLNAVDLGIQLDGFSLQVEPKELPINESDAYGNSTIDIIYRGADWFLQHESLAYKAGPIAAAWPWGSLGVMGVIGRLGSDVATAVVLTSTAGTPAAAAPATLTASEAILAPNFNPSLLFSSKLRTVPVRFQLLPYDSSGIKWFTTT